MTDDKTTKTVQIKTSAGKTLSINLYAKMNAQISSLLKIGTDASPENVAHLYAAAYIDCLRAENEKLKTALEKSVKLPLKIGDTIYTVSNYLGYKLYDYQITRIHLSVDEAKVKIKYYYCTSPEYGSVRVYPEFFRKNYQGSVKAFKTKKAAEATLKQLLQTKV